MTHRNAAVEMLIADLRDELLTPPTETQTAEHVAMMRFEAQVAPTPASRPRVTSGRAVSPALGVRGRVLRAGSTRPRRFGALFAAICVLTGSVGLDAAGAVPAAVRAVTQHITDTIVNTFGVPQAPAPQSEGARPRAGSTSVIDGARGSSGSSASAPNASGTAPSIATSPSVPASSASTPAPPTAESPASPDDPAPVSQPPAPQPPSHHPPKHNMGKDPNTPRGLPAEWNQLAVTAARTQLASCALATELAPAACPQVAAADAGATPENVQWTVLNQPLAGATAIARTNGVAGQAAISVYGLFQLRATYTVGSDTAPHVAYSSGVAQATMTWDGSTLLAVTFTSGSVADHLPDGVHVPAFERPASASDATVLTALQPGLTAWATAAGGTLVGDPTQGAAVSFDPEHGDFTVTGTYTLAASDPGGTAVTHSYTASLVANYAVVQLLSIAGS